MFSKTGDMRNGVFLVIARKLVSSREMFPYWTELNQDLFTPYSPGMPKQKIQVYFDISLRQHEKNLRGLSVHFHVLLSVYQYLLESPNKSLI